ncbi:hypothetical protein M3J09_001763 [Ascochyta lentis]
MCAAPKPHCIATAWHLPNHRTPTPRPTLPFGDFHSFATHHVQLANGALWPGAKEPRCRVTYNVPYVMRVCVVPGTPVTRDLGR